jgi:hypothetical protein
VWVPTTNFAGGRRYDPTWSRIGRFGGTDTPNRPIFLANASYA